MQRNCYYSISVQLLTVLSWENHLELLNKIFSDLFSISNSCHVDLWIIIIQVFRTLPSELRFNLPNFICSILGWGPKNSLRSFESISCRKLAFWSADYKDFHCTFTKPELCIAFLQFLSTISFEFFIPENIISLNCYIQNNLLSI